MGYPNKKFGKSLFCIASVLFLLMLSESSYGWPYPSGRWTSLVGRDLNGTTLNGIVLDGRSVVAVSLNPVESDNRISHKVRLKRTRFRGINPIGAVFTALLDDGNTIKLRIETMERSPQNNFKDVYFYTVTYPTQEGWLPLCGVDEAGNPLKAIPLIGHWDLGQGVAGGGSYLDNNQVFTFACEKFVIAKCVMAGYKPWSKTWICNQSGDCTIQSLAGHHQACTRLLRADYCGNGTSYTQDGVTINMYDGAGIRIDVNQWLFEAEWDENGAVCVVNERIIGMTPECIDYLRQEECGDFSHLFYGTLLFSEVIHEE